ncbi:MAG: polyprenyl synthetase family protein [Chitinophagaceae bacterium]
MKFSAEIIAEELSIFDSRFKEYTKSNAPLLDRIMKYVVKTKGKQLRPMLVILCSKLSGTVNESTYRAASLVELLHTATLVHDDVVDESLERRGVFSVYALWKTKVSVLVGDYLLAKGLLLSLDNHDYQVLQILSKAVREMSEGELLQIEKSRTLNLDEEIYFKIIRFKTASLIAAACSAGAYSGSQDPELTEKLRVFGEYVGMAFQIKDDLFDYSSEDIGKPTGNDIKEKKLTLPLIFTINNATPELRKKLIYNIKNNNGDPKKIRWIIDEVEKSGGIAYAQEKMITFQQQALEILQDFQTSPIREKLEELVNFTTERKK